MMKTGSILLSLFVFCLVNVAGLAAQETETSKAGTLLLMARESVNLMAKGDFVTLKESLSDTLLAVMPPDDFKALWNNVTEQMGAYRRQVSIKTRRDGSRDIAIVTCEFEKGQVDALFVLGGDNKIISLQMMPTPPEAAGQPTVPPYADVRSFEEKEVTIGTGKWAVPGTLSLPLDGEPFPAVVLIHDFGGHDRDETLGPNRPFRDLAWGLATRGIAVLRYDKRANAHEDEVLAVKDSFTIKEDAIDDALAAVSALKAEPRVNPRRVFLAGHGFGGMLLPRIAQSNPAVAGLIIMAGMTRPLEDVMVDQTVFVQSLDGKTTDEEKEVLGTLKKQAAQVKDPKLSLSTYPGDLPMGISPAYWLSLRGYDPRKTAKGLRQPMLILQGKVDHQATEADLQAWKKSLSSRKDVRFILYPDLNHLFIKDAGEAGHAGHEEGGSVSASVIKDITDWVRMH
jgi:dienelactone hydrolase